MSSGIYNVSVNFLSQGNTNGSYFFVVDSNNNTVISASISGSPYPIPGSYAKSMFDGMMGIFGSQFYYTDELSVFTDSTYFTNQGTSTKTFGSTSFAVTTYGLKNPNTVINECGISATVTAYTLEVGTPPNTSLPFVTYLHFAGTSNGQTGDYTFQLVSMTVG